MTVIDPAAVDQGYGIVEFGAFARWLRPQCSDEHGGAIAIERFSERLCGRARGGGECRLAHEVLWRIAGDEQLGKRDQVCAQRLRLVARLPHLPGVAGDVALAVAEEILRTIDRSIL